MTQALYHAASMEAAAQVLACEKTEGGFAVLLDCTPLYPEGGGQPSDTGYLGTARVRAVYQQGEDIWHVTDAPLAVGESVVARVDEPRRRDHSVQHTAEHIISGLAHQLFGAGNVGFHMAETYATLDLDLLLEQQQVHQLEQAANAAVRADGPVTARVVGQEEYEGATLRKKTPGLTGEIRVVEIPGVDSCTCCGTHCETTGQVRLVKITAADRYKGGTRITFLAGARALADYQTKHNTVAALARRFSVQAEDVAEAVLRQGEQLADAKRQLRSRTQELMHMKAAQLLAQATPVQGVAPILHCWQGLAPGEMKAFCTAVCEAEKAVVLLFAPEGEALHYACACSPGVPLSMGQLCQAVNAATGGKGGGRDTFAQGSAKRAAWTPEAGEQLLNYLVTLLQSA